MSAFIKAAVVGHPVSHSKSPLIHNHWIARYGLSGSYEAIDIAPEHLQARIPALVRQGYAGFNVTVPHKSAILPLCEIHDESVVRVGAANTIVVDAAGRLRATNTDVFGFIENLRQNAPRFDLKAGPALVLGAGGAARAVVEALLSEGCPEIFLVNRTREAAQTLARTARSPGRVQTAGWETREALLSEVALLVNATTLGMKDQPPLEIDLERLSPSGLVVDIVYSPLETVLLRAARARGNPVVTGIGMLVHQARPAFAAWFGVMPEISDDLMQKVLA